MELDSKRKGKFTFLCLFDNPLSKYLIFKRISCIHAMAVLDYLAKLKRNMGLAFGAHILHDFFRENIPYLILYQWTEFQCHIFFHSRAI